MRDIDIRRGDIYWIKGDGLQTGSEIHDDRLGIVVSSDHGNRTSNNVTVVYMTTQEKKSMVVHADVMGTKPATALCEQVYTVSKDRLERYMRTCSEAEMQQVEHALMYSLGLVDTMQPADTDKRIKELAALLEAEQATSGAYLRQIEEAEGIIAELQNKPTAKNAIPVSCEEFAHLCEKDDERIELKGKADAYKSICEMLIDRIMERIG